jgi:hypothetical protein
MHTAVLIAMAIVVAVLVYTLIRLGRGDYRQLADRMSARSRDELEVLKPCPLCGTMLRRGETVHSVVFSGPGPAGTTADGSGTSTRTRANQVQDAIAHLFGCPYCHPANEEHPRRCPVCRKVIPADGYVIARMFEKPGRKHVHVLGCTNCRTRPMK